MSAYLLFILVIFVLFFVLGASAGGSRPRGPLPPPTRHRASDDTVGDSGTPGLDMEPMSYEETAYVMEAMFKHRERS